LDAIRKRVRRVAIGIVGVLLCFCVSGCTVALKYSADISDDETEALQYAASLLETYKAHPDSREEFNINIKDFDALELGKGIVAYDVSTETPMPTGVVVYPVYENRVLVAVVHSAGSGENKGYISSSEDVEELRAFLKKNTEAVIIIDANYTILRSRTNAMLLLNKGVSKPNLKDYLRDFDGITYAETSLIGKIDISVPRK
jgi:hypothetical protein